VTGQLAKEIQKREPFASLEQEAYLNLLRTADILVRPLAALLKAHELSPTQYNVLRILRGAGPGGLACQAIASRMITRDPDMTRLLDRLHKRGLVARTRQSCDRRVVLSTVTPEGLAILAKLDQPVTDAHYRQLKHLGKDRLQALIHLLELARSPEEENSTSPAQALAEVAPGACG